MILDDLSKVVVPNVLAELLTCLTYRGAEHPLWISDVFSRDGGSLLYPCGHYYLQSQCYFIATQTHSRYVVLERWNNNEQVHTPFLPPA